MRILLRVGAILAGSAGLWTAQAAQPPTLERIASSGRPVMLHPFIVIDPTCKPIGRIQFNLLEGPRNGRVTFVDGTDFPGFPPNNPRSHCNTKKVASKRLSYTSAPGFVGEDDFTFEVIDPFGAPSRWHFHMVVRQ